VRTLRHFDERGLLVRSERTSGDHRFYSSDDFRRLLAVQHLTSLGLSLSEVKAALDDPGYPPEGDGKGPGHREIWFEPEH
jgi:DNA-binding transcriptional MerR regulator